MEQCSAGCMTMQTIRQGRTSRSWRSACVPPRRRRNVLLLVPCPHHDHRLDERLLRTRAFSLWRKG
jgi:hypothetical protein